MGVISSGADTTQLTNALLSSGLIAIVGLVFLAVGALMVPMAIMHYLNSHKFTSAFALGTVLRKTLSVKYLVSVVVMIAYFIVLSIIGGIIAGITFGLGAFLFMGIFSYIFTVTAYEVFADTYKETD